MEKKIKKTSFILMIAIIFAFMGYLKIKNIDLSEGRFILTFWKEYLVSYFLLIVCFLGFQKASES